MNCIIVTKQGVIQTPILIKSDVSAEAKYEEIIRDLLKDDFDDVVGGFIDDYTYDRVYRYLKPLGIEINYFTDLKTL